MSHNFKGSPRGCRWSARHTLADQLAVFDRLPRPLRDALNAEPFGDTCCHCVARVYRAQGLEAALALLGGQSGSNSPPGDS